MQQGRDRAKFRDFTQSFATIRILDPACGTGNFLYVSLEFMKRLEGEVLEALADLRFQEEEALSWLEGHSIDPHQFLGLEVNPRARGDRRAGALDRLFAMAFSHARGDCLPSRFCAISKRSR